MHVNIFELYQLVCKLNSRCGFESCRRYLSSMLSGQRHNTDAVAQLPKFHCQCVQHHNLNQSRLNSQLSTPPITTRPSRTSSTSGTQQTVQYKINSSETKWKINVAKAMAAESDAMDIGPYTIHPWSCSGLETCVAVKIGDTKIAFDMGYPFREAVKCQHVFISHGHIDHTAGIALHASKRNLYSMKPATYHMSPHLIQPIQAMATACQQAHSDNTEEEENCFGRMEFHGVKPDDIIKLPGGLFVKPFPTMHRVRSQGYLVYKQKKVLKPNYQGLSGKEIGALIKKGIDIHDSVATPEIAYTGDTMFDIYQTPHNPDLLKVKLLITETTYIDDEIDKQGRNGVQRARDRGHMHIQELVDNHTLFSDVQNILVIHFSDKYSVRYIKKRTDAIIPDFLKNKIHLGIQWKEKFG